MQVNARIAGRIRELEADLHDMVAAGKPIQARGIRTSIGILQIWEGS